MADNEKSINNVDSNIASVENDLTHSKVIDKVIQEEDIFPNLEYVFIGSDSFNKEELIKNFADKDDDPLEVVSLLKKVFQKEYPITRVNGLPKIPSRKGDKEFLIKLLHFYFINLRYEILVQKQKFGNSVSLRERINHIQNIKILLDHFETDKEKFPYHMFQDYIDNRQFVEFEDDLVNALHKIKDIENEDLRIRNLLRQFAKLYLSKPINDEFDLKDPGLSEELYNEFETKLNNKRIPSILLHLMTILRNEKDKDIKTEEYDLSPLYELLSKLGDEIDSIDSVNSNNYMSGGKREYKKDEIKLEKAIEDVFNEILNKYKDLKASCSNKDTSIINHIATLSDKEKELDHWKGRTNEYVDALTSRDSTIQEQNKILNEYQDTIKENHKVIKENHEAIRIRDENLEKWKDYYEEKLQEKLSKIADDDEMIQDLFNQLKRIKKIMINLNKEKYIGDTEAYGQIKNLLNMTDEEFKVYLENIKPPISAENESKLEKFLENNSNSKNKENVGNIKPPISAANESKLEKFLENNTNKELPEQDNTSIKRSPIKGINYNDESAVVGNNENLGLRGLFGNNNNNNNLTKSTENAFPSLTNVSQPLISPGDEGYGPTNINNNGKTIKSFLPTDGTTYNPTEKYNNERGLNNIALTEGNQNYPINRSTLVAEREKEKLLSENKRKRKILDNALEKAKEKQQQIGGLRKICEKIANNNLNTVLCSNTKDTAILSLIEEFDKKIIENTNQKFILEKFIENQLKTYFDSNKQFYFEAKQILQKKHYSTMLYTLYEICYNIKKSKKDIDVVKFNSNEYNALFDEFEELIRESNYDFYSEANKIFPSRKNISIKFFENSIYFYTNSNSFENTYIYIDNKFESESYDYNEELYFINDKILYLFFILSTYFENEKSFTSLPIVESLNKYIRTQKRNKKHSIKKLLKQKLDG